MSAVCDRQNKVPAKLGIARAALREIDAVLTANPPSEMPRPLCLIQAEAATHPGALPPQGAGHAR